MNLKDNKLDIDELILGLSVGSIVLVFVLTLFSGRFPSVDVFCYHECIFDWWTIVHFYCGILIGFFMHFTKYIKKEYLSAFIMIVFFELAEQFIVANMFGVLVSGAESAVNVVGDIFIGIIAVFIAISVLQWDKKHN